MSKVTNAGILEVMADLARKGHKVAVIMVPCDFCDEDPCVCECPICHTATCTDCLVEE